MKSETKFYKVSEEASERADLIKNMATGHYPGKTATGEVCVVRIVSGEYMDVRVHTARGTSVTHYNSNGEAVSFTNK